VLTDKKSARFFFRSIFNPTHHSLSFRVGLLAVRMDLVGKCCGGKLGWSDLSIPRQKLCVRYYHPHKTCCACEQRSKNPQKRIIQTIMVSTRSSDYAAIGGGGNGIGGKSQLSRLLARGPPPGGKEEKDNDSTPVACVATMSTMHPGTGDVATASTLRGGGWKGSVDDCGEDDNDGDELDSGGGNAAGGKEGTPLKLKG
jgi:hypothetical protein